MGLADGDHVIILNEGGGRGADVVLRERRSGKQHVTIEFRSEPLAFTTDPVVLGRPVALAIRDALQVSIRAVTEVVSDATLKKRQAALRAFNRGAAWAMKRYSGGRTPAASPAQTVRFFNDSGRLARGLHVQENKTDASFTVNVTANRLNPDTFSGKTFDYMLDKLRQLVPEIQNTQALLADKHVRTALEESIRAAIVKGPMGSSGANLLQLVQRIRDAARRAAEIIDVLT